MIYVLLRAQRFKFVKVNCINVVLVTHLVNMLFIVVKMYTCNYYYFVNNMHNANGFDVLLTTPYLHPLTH